MTIILRSTWHKWLYDRNYRPQAECRDEQHTQYTHNIHSESHLEKQFYTSVCLWTVIPSIKHLELFERRLQHFKTTFVLNFIWKWGAALKIANHDLLWYNFPSKGGCNPRNPPKSANTSSNPSFIIEPCNSSGHLVPSLWDCICSTC